MESGRVSERPKEPVLKTGERASVPWVRIPPLPFGLLRSRAGSFFFGSSDIPDVGGGCIVRRSAVRVRLLARGGDVSSNGPPAGGGPDSRGGSIVELETYS